MKIDPALVKALTGESLGARHGYIQEAPFYQSQDFLNAYNESKKAQPSQDQFNGIIDPGDMPNSLVINPESFMGDMATQQSSENPSYRPEIPNDINMSQMSDDQIRNILRLLRNYNTWKHGEKF